MTKCTRCMCGECCGGDFEELEQQLADMRLAVEEAYFEGRQDMLAITAGGINSDHSWEESSALAALNNDKDRVGE